jgi:hypothetical protein
MFFRGGEHNKGGLGGSRTALRMTLVTGTIVVLAVFGIFYSRQIIKMLTSGQDAPPAPHQTAPSTAPETDPEPERWIQLPIVPQPPGAPGEHAPGAAEPQPTPAELKDVKDGTPIERDAFCWLLGCADKAFGKSDLVVQLQSDADVNDLYARPEFYRGKSICLTGIVRNILPRALAENPAGLQSSTEANLDVLDKRVWIVAPRTGLTWKEGDRVRATGYFFKIRLNSEWAGHPFREPVVVLTDVETLVKAPANSGTPLPTSPGVTPVETMMQYGAILVAIYFALMFYTRRRQKANFEKLEAMRRSRRKKLDAEADEEQLQPPPPPETDV